MKCAGWLLVDGPAERDCGVVRRREATANHNVGRIPLPVPGERGADGMKLLQEIW